jgi:DNA-binding ferritin-like protein
MNTKKLKIKSTNTSSLSIKKPVRNPHKEELVNLLLKLLIDVKIYHWKTKSYPEHKATDQLYDSLNENIDKFVEILLGKDEARLNMKGRAIEISDAKTIEQFKKIINSSKVLLEKKIGKYLIANSDTDLLNIRDEILGDLNQFLYLATFY